MARWSPFKKKRPTPVDVTPSTAVSTSPIPVVAKPHRPNEKMKLSSVLSSNLITRSKYFRSVAKRVFCDLDVDGSGTLDVDELYSGVLLVHLQLAKFAGSAACKPPSRARVQELFFDFDEDLSESLDVEEFISMCTLLMGQVLGRVIFQWVFTLLISPILGEGMVR